MTRALALALAHDLAARGESLRAYCQRRGLNYSTVTNRASRVGVQIAREARRRRVTLVLLAKAQKPALPLGRLALEFGWSSYQAFARARRLVARQVVA